MAMERGKVIRQHRKVLIAVRQISLLFEFPSFFPDAKANTTYFIAETWKTESKCLRRVALFLRCFVDH